MKVWFSFVILLGVSCSMLGNKLTLRGKVLDKEQDTAIEPAVVSLAASQLWAITDEKGFFIIKYVPAGEHLLTISCLGYRTQELRINTTSLSEELIIRLEAENLALKEVVVTAKENRHNTATSYLLDKVALEHQQLNQVSNLTTLLPGGKSMADNNLAKSDARMEIRAESGEIGNASFMTAVEVDGIRLSNNASFTETKGVDLRNITTSNIESVEVITGIPSAEYGDVSGGVVKIHSAKGKAPFRATLSASPRTKSASLSQGIDLGSQCGTLNLNLERTVSIAELASPYTNYARNGVNLIYNNTWGKQKGSPLTFTATLAGNMGGYHAGSDPDAFAETYTKQQDHTLRGSIAVDWLLNKPFLTGIEAKTSLRYSNKLEKENLNKSSSTATPVFHGKEEGYFVATDYATDPNAPVSLIPAGYWYQLQFRDDRPLDWNTTLKLYHHLSWGEWRHKLKLGGEFSTSGNLGGGIYYESPQYTPTWRAYPYSESPFMKNSAFFAEDRMQFPIGRTKMELTAGIRYDRTDIDGSDYGQVGAFSPRLSFVYTLLQQSSAPLLKTLKVKGGIGQAAKLPSFAILYPEPIYKQQLTFAPGALADGTAYYAYYILPSQRIYNQQLKWQTNYQKELGIEMLLGRMNLTINAYRNRTSNGYMQATAYSPFTYKFTDQKSIEGSAIPIQDRVYTVDANTGIVTLSDRNGSQASVELPYTERTTFRGDTYATNSSPVFREGIEWVADFGRIDALSTALRLDGSYYHYRGINETLVASLPTSSQNTADGSPYPYIGYYAGSPSASNGTETRRVNANMTLTTHIPKLKLLVSMRLESTLYHASRYLSSYNGQNRGVVLSNRGDYTGTSNNIYQGNQYVAVYPEYYVSASDMNTRIPFEERFLWAKEHDKSLYNELAKLVVKTNTAYFFNANRISPYFSANLTATKEIGKHVSLSFYANNFLNNLSKISSSWNDTEQTLFGSGKIPYFDYGLTLRVEL